MSEEITPEEVEELKSKIRNLEKKFQLAREDYHLEVIKKQEAQKELNKWKDHVISVRRQKNYHGETVGFTLNVSEYFGLQSSERKRLLAYVIRDALHKILDEASGIRSMYEHEESVDKPI